MGGGAGHPRATNALMQIGVLSSEFSSKYLLRGPRFLKSLGQRAPHVRFVPEADIAPTESELTHSEISLLNIFSAFAGNTRATWTIEHDGTGRTELPFVLDKAKGYATRIWNSVLAEPHRIRRAGICILLSIGDCWHGCRDHDNNESNGAQFTHDVALQFGARSDSDNE